MEAIILAGGFGTRLQSVVKDVPKPMAEIDKKPFLEYLLQYLTPYNITKILFSVGYKQNIIKEYFQNSYKGIAISYSCEEKPLGTGGAIKKALQLLTHQTNNVLVMNGDTFFQVDLFKLQKIHESLNADVTLSLKEMTNFDRYGTVEIESNLVKKFEEKKFCKSGYINCGTYMIKKDIFDKVETTDTFSFEEFLEKNLNSMRVCYFISNDSYFIDIGIPADYEKAQTDFKTIF